MNYFELQVNTPLKYVYTGKFQSPSEHWIHQKAPLIDYELIVMTSGILYLSYDGQAYTVRPGEILLLPPKTDAYRYGFQKSSCNFYWLHFMSKHEVRRFTKDTLSKRTLSQPDHLYIPEHCVISNAEKLMILMKQLQDYIRSHQLYDDHHSM